MRPLSMLAGLVLALGWPQPASPRERIESVEPLRILFEEARGHPRLILFLSGT